MNRQDLEGEPEAVAREFFEKAKEATGGQDASIYVSLAESVCIPRQDKAEFKELMNKALAVDVDVRKESRLLNTLMQKRAEWLLSRTDELFF